jgi:RimJ/RimL family protein N-acetyltransferase
MNPAAWEIAPAGAAAIIAGRTAAVVPELTTPRLRLRAPRIGDFAAYAGIATAARGGSMSREEAWLDFAQMVAGWMMRGYGLWSVERRADGALLGFVPLNHEFGDPERELGWLLIESAEGQGYAREAAEAARAFAFDRLGLPSVVSYIDPDNSRSVRLAERLGARREPQDFEGVRVYRHVRPEHSA